MNYVNPNNSDEGEIATILKANTGWTYKLAYTLQFGKGVDDIIITAIGSPFGCRSVYHIPYFSTDKTIGVGSINYIYCFNNMNNLRIIG